jgi:hypothetical protein
VKHLEPSELELRQFAFQEAMCGMLAEVATDVVVLRAILNQQKIISDAEYQKYRARFGKDRLASYQKELNGRIHSIAEGGTGTSGTHLSMPLNCRPSVRANS